MISKIVFIRNYIEAYQIINTTEETDIYIDIQHLYKSAISQHNIDI